MMVTHWPKTHVFFWLVLELSQLVVTRLHETYPLITIVGVTSRLHSLTLPNRVLSVIAFHQKAGRSQVGSFLLDKILIPARSARVPGRTPSGPGYCSTGICAMDRLLNPAALSSLIMRC